MHKTLAQYSIVNLPRAMSEKLQKQGFLFKQEQRQTEKEQ